MGSRERVLEAEDLVVRFRRDRGVERTALDGVAIELSEGEVLGVLGPSGSGKSTLLRAIAGLETLERGSIHWAGEDITAVPVHLRGFALMFQDGQLFPHKTVGANIAYPLAIAGVDRTRSASRVTELLALVGLEGFAERRVTELSGGEQQRVALARSLAASPRLLLLDEPLSSLDRELRERLAGDLRRILVETGTTALFVTHDQEEAFAVSDRVAIMVAGSLVQSGPPAEVWAAPVSATVARFLGYSSVLDADRARVLQAGATSALALRPEALVASAAGQLTGTVLAVTPLVSGARLRLAVDGLGEVDGIASLERGGQICRGDVVGLAVDPAGIATVPVES